AEPVKGSLKQKRDRRRGTIKDNRNLLVLIPLPKGQFYSVPLPVCQTAQTIGQLFILDGINKVLLQQLLDEIILDMNRPFPVCKFLAHALQRVAMIPEPTVRICNDTILLFEDRSPIFFDHKPVLLSVVCLRGLADKRRRTAPDGNI